MKLHVWCNLWCNHEKIQGLNGAFPGLENQWICRVSYAYILYKLHVTLSDKYHWRVLLAYMYVIPWINKGSLVLYIARMRVVQHAMTDLKFGSCTALSNSSLWLKHRGLSLSRLRVSLGLHLCTSIWTVYPQYWQLFTTCTTATVQLLGIWWSI